MEIKKSDYIQSLDKGLKILKAFNRDKQTMTLSEVAKETNITRASARRFLLTFCYLGYMNKKGKKFRLNSKVLELGYNYMASLDIGEIAKPYLKALSNTINESCSIASLEDTNIVYLMRQQASKITSINLNPGANLPAHVTSLGRTIMAFNNFSDDYLNAFDYKPYTDNSITDKNALKLELIKIRQQGWGLVDQELELGVRSISVPIYSKRNTVKYAMNIGVHADRISKEKLVYEFLPLLLKASKNIKNDLNRIIT